MSSPAGVFAYIATGSVIRATVASLLAVASVAASAEKKSLASYSTCDHNTGAPATVSIFLEVGMSRTQAMLPAASYLDVVARALDASSRSQGAL